MVVYHKSCGFVVFKDGDEGREFLLLHYPAGHWDFVKGHTEEGEDELTTAIRELEEETGIKEIEVVDGFMVTMKYDYTHNGEKHEKVVDYFMTKSFESEVSISHEHVGFTWLNYEESLKKLTFDNARDVLIAAEAFLITKGYE
jgi:8-oxo-dGTP pyrophosphatase MutT (NUDIX family)